MVMSAETSSQRYLSDRNSWTIKGAHMGRLLDGAGYEIRTHDILVGNETLYH